MKSARGLLLIALISAFPAYIAAAEPRDANKLHKLGIEAFKRGETEEAIQLITRAIAGDPSDARFYSDRGVALKKAGRIQEAIQDYSKAVELKPGFGLALNNRGVAYINTGEYERAIADFAEALSREGQSKSKLYTNRGLAYAKSGNHREAISDFRKAVSFRPLDQRAFLFLGESLEAIGDRDEALKMYQLGMGLVNTPALERLLRNKIAGSEGGPAGDAYAGIPQRGATQARNGAHALSGIPSSLENDLSDSAPALQGPAARAPTRSGGVSEAQVDSYEALQSFCRDKAVATYSAAAAEAYAQAFEFLEKSGGLKALVRFEDALQIARRNRNDVGAGWIRLELGRIHRSLGSSTKAVPHMDSALKLFEGARATHHELLTLIELASTHLAAGNNEKATKLFAAAEKTAAAKGWRRLADSCSKGIPATQPSGQRPTQERPALREPERLAGAAPAPQPEKPAPPLSPVAGAVKSSETEGRDQKRTAAEKHPEPVFLPPLRPPQRLSSSPQTAEPVQRLNSTPQTAEPPPRFVDRVGRGPGTWAAAAERKPASRPTERLPREKSQSDVKTQTPPRLPDQDRQADKATIDQELAALKKANKTGNESAMVAILERLADKYRQADQTEKALHCVHAALSFRQKKGMTDGMERSWLRAGELKLKLGKPTEALEDFTRGLAITGGNGTKGLQGSLQAGAARAAQALEVDADAMVRAFDHLWKARRQGNGKNETVALHLIGSLYEKAGRTGDALTYFERARASLLAHNAQLLDRIGNKEEAALSRQQALQVFKKLDHARYLEMMGDGGRPGTLSSN